MLEALRRGTTSWIAKILFGLLVLSFAVWGIPQDFLGGGGNYVARVESTAISQEEFQRAFQREINQRSQSGQRLTTEQAREAGIDRYVLKSLMTQASVRHHSQELGLAIPDEVLVNEVRNDENLKGRDGKFSPARFEQFLLQAGLSEQGFFHLLRQDKLQAQIVGAMSNATAVPPALLDLQYDFMEETRVIEHTTIDASKIATPQEPDEAKLKEVFERNAQTFRTPELRKIGFLVLSVEDLKKSANITEEQLKEAYEATKSTYEIAEKRRIAQISFKDKAAAEAAKKAIDGGKSFSDAATEAGMKQTDTDLGLLTKAQLIDPKIADAAFALEKDKVSSVVDGTFGPVLIKVTEIEPGKTSTFEEAKDKVRDTLAGEKAEVAIQEKADLVEESRNAGKPLKEIASELSLTYAEQDADQSNRTADGKQAFAFTGADSVVPQAFTLQPGAETEALPLPENAGYAWPSVLSVTPSAPKKFEDVKEEVKALYFAEEKEKAMREFAGKLVTRLSNGEDLLTVANDAGGSADVTLPVTRNTVPQGITRGAIAQAFTLPVGRALSSPTSDGNSRILFRVKEIKPAPEPTKEQKEKLAGELRESLQNDLLAGYVGALEKRLDTQVNEKEFRRITGADL